MPRSQLNAAYSWFSLPCSGRHFKAVNDVQKVFILDHVILAEIALSKIRSKQARSLLRFATAGLTTVALSSTHLDNSASMVDDLRFIANESAIDDENAHLECIRNCTPLLSYYPFSPISVVPSCSLNRCKVAEHTNLKSKLFTKASTSEMCSRMFL
jgi:hypothetical protein